MHGSDLLPFDELWPLVSGALEALPIEHVELGRSLRRVLRADAVAEWDLPTADNSAMDGYAVRSADTLVVERRSLRILEGDAYAGSDCGVEIRSGEAVPIGTGGVIPDGADAVAIKEIVNRRGDRLEVGEPVPLGAHIRRAGEELRAGEVVVPAGTRLTAPRIAAAAAAGVRRVKVGRLPRVAVLSTGSELVPMGKAVRPGQVVNTNAPLLAMSVEELIGETPATPSHVGDDKESISRVLAGLIDDSDVLILSGGVSVGDRDLVKDILESEIGVRRLFWRVAQKPGKPTYAGRREKRWIIGLPGNPAAVATGWHTLVRPLLLALMGSDDPLPRRARAKLAAPVQPNPSRTHLRWGRGEWRAAELWIDVAERAGSHMLTDLARSDHLAVIPPGDAALDVGTEIEAIPISEV